MIPDPKNRRITGAIRCRPGISRHGRPRNRRPEAGDQYVCSLNVRCKTRRSWLTELFDQGRPQAPNLVGVLDGCLDHDQFRGWVDADALAVGAEESELAPRSREEPQEIAIAEDGMRFARSKKSVG